MSVMDKFLSIQLQKKRADDILKQLEAIDPNVILAGGAPRNWYFGEEAKDLDFYIYSRNYKALDAKLIALAGVTLTGYSEGAGIPDDYKNKNLKAVYSFNTRVKSFVEGYEKVQIMIMKEPITPEYILEDFPVNISMIYYKQNRIITTEDFLIAVSNKIIFLNPKSLSRDNSNYLRKIHGYYPDYLWLEEKPKFFTLPEKPDTSVKIWPRKSSNSIYSDFDLNILLSTYPIKSKYYVNSSISNLPSMSLAAIDDTVITPTFLNKPYTTWSVPIAVYPPVSVVSLSITDDMLLSSNKNEIEE